MNAVTTRGAGTRQGTKRILRFLFLFILLFVVLQRTYIGTRAYTHNVINHWLNAVVSANLINVITPEESVVATDATLYSSGAAIDIRRGCEGFEVVIILAAAMLAYPMSWRSKWLGIVAGSVFIYVLNLVRIVSLYYVATYKQDIFDVMHLTMWQSALILLALGFFVFWIQRTAPRRA